MNAKWEFLIAAVNFTPVKVAGSEKEEEEKKELNVHHHLRN